MSAGISLNKLISVVIPLWASAKSGGITINISSYEKTKETSGIRIPDLHVVLVNILYFGCRISLVRNFGGTI